MMKKQWYYCAIGLLASAYIFVYYSTVSTLGVAVWPDSTTYVALQAVPISSGFTFLNKMLYGRPFVVPLLFKVLGNTHRIVAAQILLYVFSWITLGITCAVIINRRWLKILSFVIILMFSMSTNLFFWPKALLSESLYISFFILSVSSFFLVRHIHGQASDAYRTNYAPGRNMSFFSSFFVDTGYLYCHSVVFPLTYCCDINLY